MTTREERQREARDELKAILSGEDYEVEFILVEGTRDVEALCFLGVTTPIDVFSHIGQAEQDVAARISLKTRSILILTDFDEKGVILAKRLTKLLTAEGVMVQVELRKKIERLMGILGLKTVESLDDWVVKNDARARNP
jgi:5S rRNA maturation endonuclease (ribonuclease M5)